MNNLLKHIFVVLIASYILIVESLFAASPPLTKRLTGGPTVMFETNPFVDYVNIYLLIDKTPFNDPLTIDYILEEIEIALQRQGAICQPLINRLIPEKPFNAHEQAFLIVRFSADDFENNLPSILKTLLLLNKRHKYLIYDQNFVYQQMQKISKFLQPDSFFKKVKEAQVNHVPPVTLHPHMYLLISGRIDTFHILNTLHRFIANKAINDNTITINNDDRLYWLFVFQRFLIDFLRNQINIQEQNCWRILAPIQIKEGQISLKADKISALDENRFFEQLRQQKAVFKDWYFKDYLKYFKWLNFDNDTKALLRLYSECYLKSDALFRLNLKPENKFVDEFFEMPSQYIEFK
ncbi:hypothetical protein ACX8XN_03840 [Calditrichota bacterium GD2]